MFSYNEMFAPGVHSCPYSSVMVSGLYNYENDYLNLPGPKVRNCIPKIGMHLTMKLIEV
jgi:hypothetical protein